MPLIDMLTDISSFNYSKVGEKHDEYFTDDNATGFTPNRETGDTTEFIVGSGNDYNFRTSSTGTDFFYNTHAVGFTINKIHKDSSDYIGVKELKFDGKSSLYSDIESNVLGTDDDYDGVRDASAPTLKSKQDKILINVDYKKVSDAKGDVEPTRKKGDLQPKESKEYVSTIPNKPQTPMFSEGHPSGAQPPYIELEDRGEDTDNQYIKFGGNAGLRATTPGNGGDANDPKGVMGFDSPFIIKEVGDRYDSLDIAVENSITILPFMAVRTVEDVIRIGKWNLTAKGIIWNAKQFMLQAQNARWETRLFNPTGPLGSLVPFTHVPRHPGNGGLLDVENPTKYSDDAFDEVGIHQIRKPASNFIEEEGNDFIDAGLKGLGIHYENRMENLRTYRIEKDKGPVPNLNPLASLGVGFGNKEFVDPTHHVKSMKGSDGKDLDVSNQLISEYSDLTTFNEKRFGQGEITNIDKSLGNILELKEGDDESPLTSKLNPVFASEIKTDGDKVFSAHKYNLGRGLVKAEGGLYSVGVSNQLQVPYHGQFGELVSSIDNLPTDFIKFRIRDAVNGKWLIFPAMLGAISDTVTPEFTKERYIGRPDDVHIYGGTSRTIGFDFKVAAFSKQEIPIIQEKMNYLMGLGYPTFKKMLEGDAEERPVAPYIYLTIGDMFNNTPGYFDSIAIATEENGTWEIDEGFQIPMSFNVTVNFVYIGKYLPTTLGKHYEVPWLKDNGAGFGTFSSDPRDGTTNKPDRQGDVGWSAEMPSYTQ